MKPSRPLTEEEARLAKLLEARPKPDRLAVTPHAEDFAAWCEHPVTRFVAGAFEQSAHAQRDAWTEMSWRAGQLDPIKHAELRARADAYMAFLETGLERYVELTKKP